MVSALISRIVILIFGTLYPAYASYKAVRTKNVKEYVKWMMYWIVFALFTSFETFSDCLLSCFLGKSVIISIVEHVGPTINCLILRTVLYETALYWGTPVLVLVFGNLTIGADISSALEG